MPVIKEIRVNFVGHFRQFNQVSVSTSEFVLEPIDRNSPHGRVGKIQESVVFSFDVGEVEQAIDIISFPNCISFDVLVTSQLRENSVYECLGFRSHGVLHRALWITLLIDLLS